MEEDAGVIPVRCAVTTSVENEECLSSLSGRKMQTLVYLGHYRADKALPLLRENNTIGRKVVAEGPVCNAILHSKRRYLYLMHELHS